jgi:hypothetical protein
LLEPGAVEDEEIALANEPLRELTNSPAPKLFHAEPEYHAGE